MPLRVVPLRVVPLRLVRAAAVVTLCCFVAVGAVVLTVERAEMAWCCARAAGAAAAKLVAPTLAAA